MLQDKMNVLRVLSLSVCVVLLGCNQSNDSDKKVVIKPAPKMSNDATAYAKQAWALMNQAEPLLNTAHLNEIDSKVRKPLRELGISWKINVKMGDSVAEGNYAFCRKALTSLDTWARSVQDNDSNIEQNQKLYLLDKAECKNALDHPSLGNTDVK